MAWGSGWGHGLRRAARGSGWGALLARRRCEGPAAFGLALHVQYALVIGVGVYVSTSLRNGLVCRLGRPVC